MKIIDVGSKGNVLRVYFGEDSLGKNYYGDDWDDKPYESNAGEVYDKFISAYIDIYVPYPYNVREACDTFYNSPFCKDDFKRGIPYISIYRAVDYDYCGELAYDLKFETKFEDFLEDLKELGFAYSITTMEKKINGD